MKNKFDTDNLFRNIKNYRGKTSSGEFKILTLENQNKYILIYFATIDMDPFMGRKQNMLLTFSHNTL